MFKRTAFNLPRIYLVQAIFLLSILSILHLRLPLEEQTILNGLKYGLGGGFLGGCISWLTTKAFGIIGSYILLLSLNIASILYLSRISFKDVILKIWSMIKKFLGGLKNQLVDFIFTPVDEKEDKPIIIHSSNKQPENHHKEKEKESPIVINHFENVPVKNTKNKKDTEVINNVIELPINQEKQFLNKEFVLPKVSLLTKGKRNPNTLNQKDINENILVLQNTLESFGVQGKVVQVSCGPSITCYEFQPAPGVKVSRVVNLTDDIALSLAAAGVRIEAPIPGKAAIGIEVPNRKLQQ